MTFSNDNEDYYDILNISHDASPLDIVKAYRETKLIFQPDSLATYSLYTKEELEAILEQIEEAYHTLADPERRYAYDHHMTSSLKSGQKRKAKHKSILTLTNPETDGDNSKKKKNYISGSSHLSGAILKDIRESQGIHLDTIASQTKISLQYLEAIEAEDVANFPPTFYLKSFLKQYAAAIGLDPELVIKAYDSLNAQHNESKP